MTRSKTYSVTISEYELEAMSQLMRQSRAIASIIGGERFEQGRKLMVYAQVVEDVIERVESANPELFPREVQ